MKIFAWLVFLACALMAAEVRFDCASFVERGLTQDPLLEETRHSISKKKLQKEALFADAILPKFTFSMLVGPAPGLKETVDDWGDTVDTWDFRKMGPFWGANVQAVQPLNLGQYRVGTRAILADIKQEEMNIVGSELKKEAELQSYYYNYLFALEMVRLSSDAKKQIDRAYEQLEEKLDEDDESVSQTDLLKLKANMHTVKEGVSEAQSGLRQVMLAIRFSLGLSEEETFQSEDSVLTFRTEPLPSLEEVKTLTLANHPDLKRLEYGLTAKSYQIDLASAKLSPEFFVMGEFTYVKSWAGDRSSVQKNAFAQDAVNKISGTLGIGFRYHLNFWSRIEKLKQARSEYRSLKLKEQYASTGILLKAEEQYHKVFSMREKAEALRESLRASDALLKGAAMRYEVSPENPDDLISAYSQNVSLQKDYYAAVCRYNIALGELIAKMGMHLADYRAFFNVK